MDLEVMACAEIGVRFCPSRGPVKKKLLIPLLEVQAQARKGDSDGVVCPKPRRVGLPLQFDEPTTSPFGLLHITNEQSEACDAKAGTELLDIILMKPPTEKLHQIIARTAMFVSRHGEQSEIVLRVKQGDNPTFGFLMPDNHLHAYFRYLVDHPKLLHFDIDVNSQNDREKDGNEDSIVGIIVVCHGC